MKIESLSTHELMESQLVFCSPPNICGASQQNSKTEFSWTTEEEIPKWFEKIISKEFPFNCPMAWITALLAAAKLHCLFLERPLKKME